MDTLTTIEVVATAFGLACVLATIWQKIWCWPAGLVQVLLYIFVFYQVRLYSDMGLHVIYVGLQIYGWYNWLHGGKLERELEVSRLTWPTFLLWGVAGGAVTSGLGYVMTTYTDASLPYGDAATTILSLIAQFLTAKKKLESWVFWIAVDVLAVGIYLAKELYPTAILYSLFLVLATTGLFAWRKSYRNPRPA
jgi:nicotinamide mononucleotide transporter